jgi:hypothetical protein
VATPEASSVGHAITVVKSDYNKNKRQKNFCGGNAEHTNAAISSDGGEDGNEPEFFMCVLC